MLVDLKYTGYYFMLHSDWSVHVWRTMCVAGAMTINQEIGTTDNYTSKFKLTKGLRDMTALLSIFYIYITVSIMQNAFTIHVCRSLQIITLYYNEKNMQECLL